MSETFFDGDRTWTLDELADNDDHLRWLLANHAPDPSGYKTFCPICCTRAPCDTVSLAATGLAHAARLADVESENARLRETLELAAAFWRPVARDMEHDILSPQTVKFLAQDFLAELHRRVLATIPAAPAGGSAEDVG